MATISFVILFTLFLPVFTSASEDHCPTSCGQLRNISFPFSVFSNKTTPDWCSGPFVVGDCDNKIQKIQLVQKRGEWYDIRNISKIQNLTYEISITDKELQQNLDSRNCESFNNLRLQELLFPCPFGFGQIKSNVTLYKCHPSVVLPYPHFNYTVCSKSNDFDIYYYTHNDNASSHPPPQPNCSIVVLPVNAKYRGDADIFKMLTATNFSLQLSFIPECYDCHLGRGQCGIFAEKKGKAPPISPSPPPPTPPISPALPPSNKHKGKYRSVPPSTYN